MKKNILGKTNIEVTELCFGVLPIGPLQKNVPVEEASDILAEALKKGINFFDTAQMYQTYPHIRLAMEKTGIRPVLASKSAALSYEDMEMAVEEALKELDIPYIDIFHLHAARADVDIFEVRKGALQCLLDYKAKGLIKAVGVATHNVKVSELAAEREDIDILFPLINKEARGILAGTREEMAQAIIRNAEKGKGIYLMKALGGGTLMDEFDGSMQFARAVEGSASIALGMVSHEEVEYNVRYFNNETDLEGILTLRNKKNPKVLPLMCISCKRCSDVCHNDAIAFDEAGKASILLEKCMQCGYCMSACPQFCIRMV
ncbi:MAG: aldo/keto reductase [Thermotaleaceae bacterium]